MNTAPPKGGAVFSVDRDPVTVEAMHKSQALLVFALAYILGIASVSWRGIGERAVLIVALLALALFAVSIYRRTFGDTVQGKHRRIFGVVIACCLFAWVGGIIRYEHVSATRGMLAQFADRQAGGKPVSVIMQGYIDGDPGTSQIKVSVPFRVTEIFASDRILFANERVLLNVAWSPEITYGAFLQLRGTPQIPTAISDFDYAAYLRKDGISYILNNPFMTPVDKLYNSTWRDRMRLNVMKPIFSIRNRFVASLQKNIPEPASSYIVGILLGIRSQLSDTIREAFNRTSTSHVLAISGYNISIVGQLVMGVLLLALYRRQAFWVTVVMIGLFALMTGASASVLRAAIMGILVLAASSYGRLYDGTTAVVTAGALMLLINPLLLKDDVGFQLSFVATLGIMLLYEPIDRWLRRWHINEPLRPILATTAGAQVAVMPLLAYHFQTISLVALPVNLLILPFVPPAMLVGFIAGFVGLAWSFGAKVIGIIAWSISMYQLTVVQWFARIPWATLEIHVAPAIVLALYIIMGVYLWRHRYAR